MLNKKLMLKHWLSLFILFLGVSTVQIQNATKKTTPTVTSAGESQLVGLAAVGISCFSSGFAGVYFEKILKGSKGSVWLRNTQLGMFGTVFGLIGALFNDGSNIEEKGFFYGYDSWVLFMILMQAIGGILVGIVVKYADNILKGFATSGAILLSCVASVFLFDYAITWQFTVGCSLVVASVCLYGKADVELS